MHARRTPPCSGLALVLAVGALPSRLALAQEGGDGSATSKAPLVLVVPYQPIAREASPELAAQVTAALVKELETAEGFRVKVLETPAPRKPTGEADMSAGQDVLAKAYKRLNAAEKLMKKYRFEQAIVQYRKALDLFAEAAPAVDDLEPVVDAYISLGVAAFRRSREEMAREALAQAVVLDPERTLDPRAYPPLFLRIYDKIYRERLNKPRGAIVVESDVAGAEVFYDGKSVGATPIKLRGVPPGRHFVRVVKEGAGVWGTVVEVASGETAEVTAQLERRSEAPTGGGFVAVAGGVAHNRVDVVVSDAAAELARKAGADYAIFGGLRKGEASISVYTFLVDASGEHLLRLVDLDIDLDLLSVSIEAFKLIEDLNNNLAKPGQDLGPGPHEIVPGLGAGQETSRPAEVDVGPAVPDSRGRAPLARGVLEGGEETSRRRVIDTGAATGRRRHGRLDEESSAFAEEEESERETIAEIDEGTPWYRDPLTMALVGTVGAAVVAGGVVGGIYAYRAFAPPTSVTVQAEWP